MSIEAYGTGERITRAARLAREAGLWLGEPHLVLLPVPTTRDKKHVSGTDIPLADTLCNVTRCSTVVGYGLPDNYKGEAEARGARVLDLSCDGEFLAENAYVTALGTLSYVLKTTERIPQGTRFGIVGYGRIGSRLVRLLLFMGADVRIYTSKALTRLELGECGISTVGVSRTDGGEYGFSGLDILINTAPKDMSAYFKHRTAADKMRIIELASGNNFDGVVGVEALPSLPDKTYPESAGRAYFEAVMRYCRSEGDGR